MQGGKGIKCGKGHMKFTETFTVIEAKWQTVNLGCVSKHTPVSVQTGLKTVAPIPLWLVSLNLF